MHLVNTKTSYGLISRCLHGIVAVLFLLLLLIGSTLHIWPRPTVHHLVVNIHKLTGVMTFFISVLFLLWSVCNQKPCYPATMPWHERYLAMVVRFMLYVLIIIMPLSGWVMATAAGKLPYIGSLTLPCPFVPMNRVVATFARTWHTYFAWTLFTLIVLHTLGALKHHFIDKSQLLVRMFCDN